MIWWDEQCAMGDGSELRFIAHRPFLINPFYGTLQ